MQVTGNVLQGHVSDSGAPRQVQAAELAQVLRHQLHAIVSDLGAAGEAECRQVGQAVHHIHHAVIGDLPARVKPQSVGGVALKRGTRGGYCILSYAFSPPFFKPTCLAVK